SEQQAGVGMAQTVKRHPWQIFGEHNAPPVSRQVVGRHQAALNGAEHRRVGLEGPGTDCESPLPLLHLVSSEHGDGICRQADVTPAALCLWRFQPQPCLSLLEAALNAEDGAVEIDIAPLKAEQLTAPHAGGEREGNNGIEPVTVELELGEHAGNLISRKYLEFLVLDDRELGLEGRGVLDAPESPRQNAVCVQGRPWRQPAAYQCPVPRLYLDSGEVTNSDVAQVRGDLSSA